MTRELTELEKTVQEYQVDLLKLEIAENRKHNLIMTGIIVGLFSVLVIFLASLFVWAYSHQQDNFLGFLGQYDEIESTVERDGDANITSNNKTYGENSSINSTLNDIKISGLLPDKK